VGYFDIIELLKNCKFVVSDSGGLQKEAFFFKKNCLVIRDETEWTELVELGYNFVVGANTQIIIETAELLEQKKSTFNVQPYGRGNAAEKIVLQLKQYFEKFNV
jgi:UDP-GlcNAc3NAcA epimerase